MGSHDVLKLHLIKVEQKQCGGMMIQEPGNEMKLQIKCSILSSSNIHSIWYRRGVNDNARYREEMLILIKCSLDSIIAEQELFLARIIIFYQ